MIKLGYRKQFWGKVLYLDIKLFKTWHCWTLEYETQNDRIQF